MPDLLVRDLPAHVKSAMTERARRNGHSLSQEARLLIETALRPAPASPTAGRLGTRIRSLVPPDCDEDITQPRDAAEREQPDFA